MRKKRRRSRGGRSRGCQECRPAGCRNDDTELGPRNDERIMMSTWQLRSCIRASVCLLSWPIRHTVDSSTTDWGDENVKLLTFFCRLESLKNGVKWVKKCVSSL